MSFYLDNRNVADITEYQEDRIGALRRRITELEQEKRDQLAERDLEILSLHRVIQGLRERAIKELK